MHHRTYIGTQLHAVLSSAEEEKKRKNNSAAEAHRASFTPFVVSTDGMLGREANFLQKRLAQSISIKWKKPCTGANHRMAAFKAVFCNTSSNKFLLAWFSHQVEKWRWNELPKLD